MLISQREFDYKGFRISINGTGRVLQANVIYNGASVWSKDYPISKKNRRAAMNLATIEAVCFVDDHAG